MTFQTNESYEECAHALRLAKHAGRVHGRVGRFRFTVWEPHSGSPRFPAFISLTGRIVYPREKSAKTQVDMNIGYGVPAPVSMGVYAFGVLFFVAVYIGAQRQGLAIAAGMYVLWVLFDILCYIFSKYSRRGREREARIMRIVTALLSLAEDAAGPAQPLPHSPQTP